MPSATDPAPFVVFALPRSRTRWLSCFLQYGSWQVGHEELRHCRSLDDVRSWLSQPYTGTVETAAAPWWRLLERYAPGARVVTVRRPVEAVMTSLRSAGLQFDEGLMWATLRHADRKLDQIEHRLDVLSVRYCDLADEAVCARLFEHCLQLPHDPQWWSMLDPMNLQVSIEHQMRYFVAHAPQVE